MTDVTGNVEDILLERLAASTLAEPAQHLVVAALLGQTQLDAALGGVVPPRPRRQPTQDEQAETIGIYLTEIEVTGFRGVGETATLPLEPGPGLTIVTGRNGSGKSSFAEAAELALTGVIHRLTGKTQVWRDGWRNLHHTDTASVRVKLLVDGHRDGAVVGCRWKAGADLEAREPFFQAQGQPRGSIEDLGWGPALRLYRPFLSYGELGDLINGSPSEAFDALYNILGLNALVTVKERLTAARRSLTDVQARAKAARTALDSALAGHTDARAGKAGDLLRKKMVDIDGLKVLATADAAPDDAVVSALQRLARLVLPDRTTISSAMDRLAIAQAAIEAAAGTPAAKARELAGLLSRALRHHAERGDGPCPVCQGSRLDNAWATRAAQERDALNRQAAELDQAHETVRSVLSALRAALPGPPADLASDIDGLATAEARQAWQRWSDLIGEEPPAAEKVLAVFDQVTTALDPLVTAAQERLDRIAQAWHPVAVRIEEFVASERASRAATEALANLKKAIEWLTAADDDIRNDSMLPIARRAGEIWRSLRQGSSIDIGGIRLVGAATRRHVDIDVTIDDVGGAALSVMSQGELHSLGLALFLPRATLPVSPFRFLLIDDPVQAMDPAKVHGLAEVLSELAKTRQVVVFTHDDRLPAAIRHLGLDNARIVEVTRGLRSRVQVSKASKGDPAERYLDDAMAIAQDRAIETDVRLAVTATQVREAIESVCHDRVRRRESSRGTPTHEVETRLQTAHKLREKLALALLDDAAKVRELREPLARLHSAANDVVRQANQGAHGGPFTDPIQFVRRAEQLVRALRR